MSKGPVRYGDTTTHGGHVMTASSSMIIDSKACALVGDRVHCPQHGEVEIMEGDDCYTENGRSIAPHRCRTTCGAEILASTDEFEF